MYGAPVIQKIINETWFEDTNDEGIVYHKFFHPHMPLVTIALVLTAVRLLYLPSPLISGLF